MMNIINLPALRVLAFCMLISFGLPACRSQAGANPAPTYSLASKNQPGETLLPGTTQPDQVPIEAWIAQGIPEDTLIKFNTKNGEQAYNVSASIYADGKIETTRTQFGEPASGSGYISQEELKEILMQFAKADFFSLASDGFRVYNVRSPSPENEKPVPTDMDDVSISLTLREKTHTIDFYYGYIHDQDDYLQLEKLWSVLYKLSERFISNG